MLPALSVFRTAAVAALVPFVLCSLVLSPKHVFAQSAPVVERPVAFDSAGRILVITPATASRLAIATGVLPVTGAYRESRIFRDDAGAFILVVQLMDGSVERHPISAAALALIQRAVSEALVTQEAKGARDSFIGSGIEISEPGSAVFTRNQTLLGLLVYGPAVSAILSGSNGAAAGGGYLVAAGTSFFIAANVGKTQPVTKAQASLSGHTAIRGALYGLAAATVARADGGAQVGAPILLGALGGTVLGYNRARPLSDGEAAASGLGADLAALTTLGVSGAAGAFTRKPVIRHANPPYGPPGGYDYVEKQQLQTKGRVALVAGVAAGVAGYAVGPNYARRAKYNVTDGDVDVVFASAMLGSLATSALVPYDADDQTVFGVATAGLITGAVLGDRLMARRKDRTGSEGTLTQLGAFAGGLMGGGVAVMAEGGQRMSFVLVATGGAFGMAAAERILKPAPDAGPLRGVIPHSVRDAASRVEVNMVSLATALVLGHQQSNQPLGQHAMPTRLAAPVFRGALAPPSNASALPVVRISW